MKQKGIVAVFCLGVALATTGCGGADGLSDVDALGNVAQGSICLDCDNGGGDTGGSVTLASTAVDLAQFQQMANAQNPRCVDAIPWGDAMGELNFALSNNLITRAAYDWGVAHRYFPIINRDLRIGAVCSF